MRGPVFSFQWQFLSFHQKSNIQILTERWVQLRLCALWNLTLPAATRRIDLLQQQSFNGSVKTTLTRHSLIRAEWQRDRKQMQKSSAWTVKWFSCHASQYAKKCRFMDKKGAWNLTLFCCATRGTPKTKHDEISFFHKYLHLTGLPNKACTWFGEVCSCSLSKGRNKVHQTTYKPYSGALYMAFCKFEIILQGSRIRLVHGLVNFVPALA